MATFPDIQIYNLILKERRRQEQTLMLIPSENYASQAVMQAVGSELANKYSEGYPKKRYYQGQEFVDKIELLCQERALKLFNLNPGKWSVNVQPYSGSPANAAIYFALLEPGDKIMGLTLSHGGHLTHGHPKITFSGKFYKTVQYEVGRDGWLNYEQVEKMAIEHRPKIIVAGTTAYPRLLDFKRFKAIAEKTNAFLLADISHISGLIAAGVHPSPFPYADVVMTTTHKTLRGPRGAIIFSLKEYAKQIDRAVFPGLQGGPHINSIAGIAVSLKEASNKNFKQYGKQVVNNAKVLAWELTKRQFKLVSGGTDNHLILVDLRNKAVSGKQAAVALEQAGIVLNYNTIPFDPNPPFNPSGIRLGTPAVTSRGMKEKEMRQIAGWIDEVITNIDDKRVIKKVASQVKQLCKKFPIKKEY